MRHWYREHFSTHQFFADLLLDFERRNPSEELDLLESDRDRHGYDCVLIKHAGTDSQTRFVQLKSTEKKGAPIHGIHSRLVLSRGHEIAQVQISKDGVCEYRFFSDFGRIAVLALGMAHSSVAARAKGEEPAVIKALAQLSAICPGIALPRNFSEVQQRWTNPPIIQWHSWDAHLCKAPAATWANVIEPLVKSYKVAYPNWNEAFDLNSCWTRKIRRSELISYLFR